jgi:hypothetical protein
VTALDITGDNDDSTNASATGFRDDIISILSFNLHKKTTEKDNTKLILFILPIQIRTTITT